MFNVSIAPLSLSPPPPHPLPPSLLPSLPHAPSPSLSDVYTNGRGICETLWGDSFIYSNYSQMDPNRQCMTFWWPLNQTNPNTVAISNLFGDQVNTVTPAPCTTDERPTSRAKGLMSLSLPLLGAVVFSFTIFTSKYVQ